MIIARFVVETATPMHCGGGQDPTQDQPVTRDAFGFWRVPGSSVAGTLRTLVEDRLGADAADRLFGTGNGSTTASLVWCTDAELLDYDGGRCADKVLSGERVQLPTRALVRDHVRLDLDTGTGVEGGKFDEEIVPPGARFALQLTLDGWDREVTAEERTDFLRLCRSVKDGLRLGGKRASGYGRTRTVQAQCREFDLFDDKELAQWLALGDGPTFAAGDGGKTVDLDAVEPLPPTQVRGFSAELVLPLETMGPMLVGGANDRDDVDMTFLLTPHLGAKAKEVKELYTVPGSSVRGALRHRAYHVAQALGKTSEEARALIADIFGEIGADDTGRAGKIVVEDMYFAEDAVATVVPHVAIDRFTGGAYEGALFDEAPVWKTGTPLELRICAMELENFEARVLLHALLDLLTGDLPLGGGVNRGNGRVRLRGLEEKGLAETLRKVEGICTCNGKVLDRTDDTMLASWLEALEG